MVSLRRHAGRLPLPGARLVVPGVVAMGLALAPAAPVAAIHVPAQQAPRPTQAAGGAGEQLPPPASPGGGGGGGVSLPGSAPQPSASQPSAPPGAGVAARIATPVGFGLGGAALLAVLWGVGIVRRRRRSSGRT